MSSQTLRSFKWNFWGHPWRQKNLLPEINVHRSVKTWELASTEQLGWTLVWKVSAKIRSWSGWIMLSCFPEAWIASALDVWLALFFLLTESWHLVSTTCLPGVYIVKEFLILCQTASLRFCSTHMSRDYELYWICLILHYLTVYNLCMYIDSFLIGLEISLTKCLWAPCGTAFGKDHRLYSAHHAQDVKNHSRAWCDQVHWKLFTVGEQYKHCWSKLSRSCFLKDLGAMWSIGVDFFDKMSGCEVSSFS